MLKGVEGTLVTATAPVLSPSRDQAPRDQQGSQARSETIALPFVSMSVCKSFGLGLLPSTLQPGWEM